ncbi:MAG: hypothetical protein J0I50_07595, partial [Microbacterium sp.]|nr:hypothetical protein [Microbacterium sp.]
IVAVCNTGRPGKAELLQVDGEYHVISRRPIAARAAAPCPPPFGLSSTTTETDSHVSVDPVVA